MAQSILPGNTSHTLYDCNAISKGVFKLTMLGYTMRMWCEGCLGHGCFVMEPPDDRHYYYICEEVYLNEWSSAHLWNKRRKLPDFLWNLIEEYERGEANGEG